MAYSFQDFMDNEHYLDMIFAKAKEAKQDEQKTFTENKKIPMDLEQEFSKIVDQIYESIKSRVSAGELTKAEGDALVILIQNKLYPAETFYEDANMEGWNQSQKCW